ncbi:hypothetical protein PVAP13_5KG309663 [Panicum virgatum]|uniref:Uncharacterized protein n=1 Tax=Panicum virgatum TaxID=38727 RepID=A0A8T0SNQ8_PANVG|nr:hypothetical protein PVAP13_5KG309663 [Panicum virgatum]
MTGRPHLPASLLLQRAGRTPSPTSLTPRPHSSAPFFHLPSFFPAPSALCSVQPAAALWTSPRRGPTPIPAGPLDSPTRILFLLEASPLEPDHAELLGDPLRPRAHHGRNPRRGVHAGHARPKFPVSSVIGHPRGPYAPISPRRHHSIPAPLPRLAPPEQSLLRRRVPEAQSHLSHRKPQEELRPENRSTSKPVVADPDLCMLENLCRDLPPVSGSATAILHHHRRLSLTDPTPGLVV